ncbi:MAG: hypothetical protein Q8891_09970 [Bacteroidota bacterium]|jgi:hypothetical protein|nr:hypothetical protein [Bacteroidota bacterium]
MKKNNINIGIIRVFFLVPILFACNHTPGNKNKDKSKASMERQFLQKPPSSFGDTLAIQFPSAVFYQPDSLQLEKIKSVNNKMVYESLTHNCFYQMRNARMVLKKYWPQIHVIETSKARYLLFIKANKKTTCIDLNSKNDICGILLFDGKKEPELVDMMNIDTGLEFYFKK